MSGLTDGSIKLWDAQSASHEDVEEVGHTNYVCSVAVHPSGRLVASGSGD